MMVPACMPVTHPQLQQLLRELDDASAQITAMVEAHDDRVFNTQPAAGAWSAAQAIAHLTLTNREMVGGISRSLHERDEHSFSDSATYSMGFMGALLRWTLEPPYRMKMPTTPPFVPASTMDRRVVLDEFLAQQRRVAEVVAAAQGKDLSAARVVSPFNANVKYSAFAALRIITTHERRHIWQAEQALARVTASSGG